MPGVRVTGSVRFTPHSIEDILRVSNRTEGVDVNCVNSPNLSKDYLPAKDYGNRKTENAFIRDADLNREHRNTDPETMSRRRKIRTTFTGRQIFELEKMFETKKYLNSSERSNLSR